MRAGLLFALALALLLAFAATAHAQEEGIPFTVVDTDPHPTDGIRQYPTGNHIVRDSEGTIYVVYTLRTTQRVGWYNYLRASSDDGATWSNAVRPDSLPDSISAQSLAIDGDDVLHLGFNFNVGTFYTRSEDGGQSWLPSMPLHDGGWGDWDYLPSIVVSDTGHLHAAYMTQYGWNSPPSNLVYKESTDGGDGWSERLDLTSFPRANGDYGVYGPNLYQGKDGWFFLTFNYLHTLNAATYNSKQMLVYYDGLGWSEPITVSTPGLATRLGGDMAVDSAGLLHLTWIEANPQAERHELKYRTFSPVTRIFSPIRTLSGPEENLYSVTMGVYAGDKVVIAYDLHSQEGSAVTYQGVYARTSDDDFATASRVSTHPNARGPSLRSLFSFMHQPERQDITWIEPNEEPIPGSSLVYGDLSGLAPPRLGMTVNTFATKIVNPGQLTPVLISYRNAMTETATGAVLVAHLPDGIPLQSCSGDAHYHYAQHTAIWQLGDLAPGAQARFVCWLRIPWGMAERKAQVVVKLDADNSPTRLLDLAFYREYDANPVTGESYMSQAEIADFLAQARPGELHGLALARGFTFSGVGQRITHSQGQTTRVLAYTRFAPLSILLLMESDGNAFLIRQDDGAVELLDQTGGLLMDSHTGLYTEHGDWGVEQTAASRLMGPASADSVHQQFPATYGTCVRNCMIAKGAMIPVDAAIDTVMAPFKAGWGALKAGYNALRGDAEGVAKDLLEAVPYKNVTQRGVELLACRSACADNANEYDCGGPNGSVGKQWCEGNLRYRHYCAGLRMWRPTPLWFNCTSIGQVCVGGECVENACRITWDSARDLLKAALAETPGCRAAADQPSNCGEDEITVVPAHDPNAKAVSPQGDILPGELLTYLIEYENVGEGTAYDVFILDVLDENLDENSLLLSGNGQYNPAMRQASWFIGEVAPGAGGMVTMTVRARQGLPSGTLIPNQAEVHFPSAFEVTPTDLVVNTINTLVAEPQALETVGATPVDLHLAGREASGATPAYAIAATPLYGTLSGEAPHLVYQAMPGFSGLDEFTFVAQHGGASSPPARVTIRVHPDPADSTPPAVVQTYPPAEARQVALSGEPMAQQPPAYLPRIWVHFSKPLDPASLDNGLSLTNITGTLGYDEGSRTLFFTPAAPLSPGSVYTATLSGQVADRSGNALGQAYSWRFTTAGAALIQVTLPQATPALIFPALDAGQSSPVQVIQVKSQGVADLIIGQLLLAGSHPGDFEVTGDGCSGQTLPPQSGCTVQVRFTPTAEGLRTALLSIPSNDPFMSQAEVALGNHGHILYLPALAR